MKPALALALATCVAGAAAASPPSCAAIDPGPQDSGHALQAANLIELRDLGWTNASDAPLSLSPDGRTVAFVLRQADIADNNYCQALILLDLASRRWTRIDTGGEILLSNTPWEGREIAIPSGVPQTAVPKWSPDGRQLVYLRRDRGVTQVWLANVASGTAAAISHLSVDVEDVAWDKSGRSIIIASRPGFQRSRDAMAAEALQGFHYDDRFLPIEASHPIPASSTEPFIQSIDIATGEIRPATADEGKLLRGATAMSIQPVPDPGSPSGDRVEIGPADPDRLFFADTLRIRDRLNRPLPCDTDACRGRFAGHWWADDGNLYFLKRDGWAESQSSLYRWSPARPIPRRVMATDALITGCLKTSDRLICVDESSLRPRHIVSISLRTGSRYTVYDPNPAFAHVALQPARRLYWKNAFGLESFGDLVLPPHPWRSAKLPLVVVQYSSRGFLRGGTGDEVPIQLFAKAGFAVLSADRPRGYGETMPARSVADLNRNNNQGLMDRRSVQSSLETGIRILVARGIVDPSRIGLTGLSDGAASVRYALIHSDMFAAVGMAQCCESDISQALGGPSISAHSQAMGIPAPGEPADAYWDQKSLARSADRMNVPMLVQISDGEYLDSLVPWLVLRTQGKPIDMYVFPNEHHIKLQPAHRLAVYERYLAWFAFWLQDRVTPFLSSVDLQRWEAWKQKIHSRVEKPVPSRPNAEPSPRPLPTQGSADTDRYK